MLRTKNFLSSGKKGDLLYQLYLVKALGGGNLYLTAGEFEEPLESVLESCGRLVEAQPYVQSFAVHRGEPIDVDLDAFRRSPALYRSTLLDVMCQAHGLHLPPAVERWMDVPPDARFHNLVVIHRRVTVVKERDNALFDWHKVLSELGSEHCVFVSRLESEWHDFGHPEVRYYCPKDNYEHAQIIRACRLFVGNTCFGTALADALGADRITEASYGLDRKHFAVNYSPNARYFASPWDYTFKAFQALSLRTALRQEWHYRKGYHTYLGKRFLKRMLRMVSD